MARIITHNPAFATEDMDWIGFDLDHALVRYHVPATMELIHSCLTKFLIEHKKYPAEYLDKRFMPEVCFKGAIFDQSTGNILSVDKDGRVMRAIHGFRVLTSLEIERTWPGGIWPGISILKSHTKHESFFVFITYFDMPCIPILARLVEHADAVGRRYDFLKDVLDAFNFNFDHTGFDRDAGHYFPVIKSHPEKYLLKRDDLKEWLLERKAAGKRFFLCTNSHVGYGTFLLEFSFGTDWAQLFDVAIFNGLKPGFFSKIHPFFDFDEVRRTEGAVTTTIGVSGLKRYCQGNATVIQALADAVKAASTPIAGIHVVTDETGALLSKPSTGMKVIPSDLKLDDHMTTVAAGLMDAVDDELDDVASPQPSHPANIAYVGDHIHGDVLAAKSFGWYAIAIVEELEIFTPKGRPCVVSDFLGVRSTFGGAGSHFAETDWGDFYNGNTSEPAVPYFADLLSSCSDVEITDAALLRIA